MKALIIENNESMLEFISLGLEVGWPGLQLVKCNLSEDGVKLVEDQSPDFIILDPQLPDTKGLNIVKEIRFFSTIPIIVVAQSANESSIVKGLELGADEFITQPFGQLELLARVRAIMRRQRFGAELYINCGSMCLYPSTGELHIGKRKLSLTRTECTILEQLLKNRSHIVTYQAMSEALWGDYCLGAVDAIRVYVRRLRSKLEGFSGIPSIVNKPGVGYFVEELS